MFAFSATTISWTAVAPFTLAFIVLVNVSMGKDLLPLFPTKSGES